MAIERVVIGSYSDYTSLLFSSLYHVALGKCCFVNLSSSTFSSTVFLYNIFGWAYPPPPHTHNRDSAPSWGGGGIPKWEIDVFRYGGCLMTILPLSNCSLRGHISTIAVRQCKLSAEEIFLSHLHILLNRRWQRLAWRPCSKYLAGSPIFSLLTTKLLANIALDKIMVVVRGTRGAQCVWKKVASCTRARVLLIACQNL
jgi:hypothetical protein